MLMNSLCALALGFLLDTVLGDTKSGLYPLNVMKSFTAWLEKKLKNAYADTDEAQNAAGGMFSFLCIAMAVVIGVAVYMITYAISDVIGILAEGIMCWTAISVKTPRATANRIMRAVKVGSLDVARKKLGELTNKDVSEYDAEQIIRGTVEATSAGINDNVVAPMFWCAILGGVGGIVYRSISLMNKIGGMKSGKNSSFAKIPTSIEKAAGFIPAKIAAFLAMADVSFLKLDSGNAAKVYYRDRNLSTDTNAGQLQAVCAGAVHIAVESGYPDSEQAVIGRDGKEPATMDIYWVNQLASGTEIFMLLITAAVRLALFFIF